MKTIAFVIALVLISCNAFAVKPPSVKEREEASSAKETRLWCTCKQAQSDLRKYGCKYGCYRNGKCPDAPKEGQLYYDSADCKTKKMPFGEANLPWDQH